MNRPRVDTLSFSADSLRLATSSGDRPVRVWRVADGAVLHTLQGHRGLVDGVAFHPVGQRPVSVGNDQTLRVGESRIPVDFLSPEAPGAVSAAPVPSVSTNSVEATGPPPSARRGFCVPPRNRS